MHSINNSTPTQHHHGLRQVSHVIDYLTLMYLDRYHSKKTPEVFNMIVICTRLIEKLRFIERAEVAQSTENVTSDPVPVTLL